MELTTQSSLQLTIMFTKAGITTHGMRHLHIQNIDSTDSKAWVYKAELAKSMKSNLQVLR